MRVTVIGAGIMGLSTAWALSRRGHAVTVVEQGPVPNPMGSSVDQHRLIRYPYGAMAGYTALVGPAYAAWDRLWSDLGERLYRQTGTLILGSAGHPWVDAALGVLGDQEIETTEIPPDQIPERFPLLTDGGVAKAVHLETGGVLMAGRIVEVLAHKLAGDGVAILTHMAAKAVDTERGAVDLADGRRLDADRVVVAAGPWVGRLLPEIGGRVTASRQLVVYVAPPPDKAAAWAEMPMVLDLSPERIFYVVPPVMGTGMKIGDHAFSMTGDPDRDRDPGVEEARALFDLARERLAGIEDYHLDEAKTCFYTVEPEERFIVETVASTGLVMAGFSGHGFKFGPLMGEAVADVFEGRRDAGEVAHWAAGRAQPRAAE